MTTIPRVPTYLGRHRDKFELWIWIGIGMCIALAWAHRFETRSGSKDDTLADATNSIWSWDPRVVPLLMLTLFLADPFRSIAAGQRFSRHFLLYCPKSHQPNRYFSVAIVYLRDNVWLTFRIKPCIYRTWLPDYHRHHYFCLLLCREREKDR